MNDRLIRIQGAYYLASAAWSLVHRRSFEAITGPKDGYYWLVQSMAAILLAVGAVLVSARTDAAASTHRRLAAATALALAAVDLRHGVPGNISRIYALDGLLQLGFALTAIAGMRRGDRRR